MYWRFNDRSEAGSVLAGKLMSYANQPDVVVLALPRGGVPVGFEVAAQLRVPLDVFLVRKVGVPGQEELAMGAVASGGVCFLNEEVIQKLRIPRPLIEKAIGQESVELSAREAIYRKSDRLIDLRGRKVIIVDDGLATGASMHAAVTAVRQQQPSRIVVAVPVAPIETCEGFKPEVEEIICLETPDPFFAVGEWYENFGQVHDEEVRHLLEESTKFQQVIPA